MRLYRPSAPRPGSAALILPESFGNIYAGEPFVAYVAVTNGGPAALRDVLVTAKLQAPSAKRAVDLPDTFASKRDAAEAELVGTFDHFLKQLRPVTEASTLKRTSISGGLDAEVERCRQAYDDVKGGPAQVHRAKQAELTYLWRRWVYEHASRKRRAGQREEARVIKLGKHKKSE